MSVPIGSGAEGSGNWPRAEGPGWPSPAGAPGGAPAQPQGMNAPKTVLAEVTSSKSRETYRSVRMLRKSGSTSKDTCSNGWSLVERKAMARRQMVTERLMQTIERAEIICAATRQLNEEHARQRASSRQPNTSQSEETPVKMATEVELHEMVIQRSDSPKQVVEKMMKTMEHAEIICAANRKLKEEHARQRASFRQSKATQSKETPANMAVEVELHEVVVQPTSSNSQLVEQFRLVVGRAGIVCKKVFRPIKESVARGLAYSKRCRERCAFKCEAGCEAFRQRYAKPTTSTEETGAKSDTKDEEEVKKEAVKLVMKAVEEEVEEWALPISIHVSYPPWGWPVKAVGEEVQKKVEVVKVEAVREAEVMVQQDVEA
eukprot:gene17894-24286_t